MKTPPNGAEIPVIHNFSEFYTFLYSVGSHIPKRHLLGLWEKIEERALRVFSLLIEAAFASQYERRAPLYRARIIIEILKRLIRTAYQLTIISEKQYVALFLRLVPISKMVSGWIKYMER